MPGFRVSGKARDDIRDIGRYTQELWGRAQRRIYLSDMETQFRHLAENPDIAPKREEFDPPVRLFRYGNHLIVYRSENDGILIVRILHERMDIPANLGG